MDDKVEIRVDENITTKTLDQIATPEDVFKLHDFPEKFLNNSVEELDKGDKDPVTVCVMDSGIDQKVVNNHPWFAGDEVVKKFNAVKDGEIGKDNVGHGTGVASLISRATPQIELYDVKIFSNKASTGFPVIRDAYQWIMRHADEIDIVNMSWGAGSDIPEIDKYHKKLIDLDVIDVVAAGNSGGEGGSPATTDKAFSVGALTEEGEPTRFSSWDPDQGNPEVGAIGKDVKVARARNTSMGTPINKQFTKSSGTSFAAPYTAAAYVNALYQKRMNWDGNFTRTAEDIPGTKKDGAGILKLNEALLENTPPEEGGNNKAEASSWNFRGNDTLWIDADWLPSGDTSAELLNETKDYIDIRIEK